MEPCDTMRPPAQRGSNGYTLVEIVIATGLAALLSVILYTAFDFLQLSSHRLRNYAEMHDSAQLTIGYLGRDLRQAVRVEDGSETHLSLILLSAEGTPYRVFYQIDREAGTLQRTSKHLSFERILLRDLENPTFFFEDRLGNPSNPEDSFHRAGFSGKLHRRLLRGETTDFVVSSAFILRNLESLTEG